MRGEKDDEKWSFPCLEDKQGNKLVPLKKKKTFPHYSQWQKKTIIFII